MPLRITGNDGGDARAFFRANSSIVDHLAGSGRTEAEGRRQPDLAGRYDLKVADAVTLRQGAYARLGLMASPELTDDVSLALNLDHATDSAPDQPVLDPVAVRGRSQWQRHPELEV